MKQLLLFRPPRADKRAVQLRKIATYERANLECAEIIAADPRLNVGLAAEWSGAILERNRTGKRNPLQ